MADRVLSDFEQGYNYAHRRYGELVDSFGLQRLRELAESLSRMGGSDAEAARGIAAGIEDMAQAGQEGRGETQVNWRGSGRAWY